MQKASNKLEIVVLQHPQEARNPLSTASLLCDAIENSTLKVGLSWRSFRQVLGKDANPKEWAVLYLGTKTSTKKWSKMPFAITDSKDLLLKKASIKGIVLLDGTWSQSKTLWWRNPWLLKLNRLVINQTPVAQYAKLRKEPRKNCLSTIEAAVFILDQFEEKGIAQLLKEQLETFIVSHQVKDQKNEEIPLSVSP